MRGDPKYLLPGTVIPVRGAGLKWFVGRFGFGLGFLSQLNPFFCFPSKETFEDGSLGRHELKL